MEYNANAKRPNNLLPKGEYPAKITEVKEKISKAGNPMFVIDLEVYDNERSKWIRDYIVIGGEYSQDWKLGHLVKSCGLAVVGKINAENLVDRNVRVKVKIKPAKGDFPEGNVIDDYIEKAAGDTTKAETGHSAAPTKPAAAGIVDEPPF